MNARRPFRQPMRRPEKRLRAYQKGKRAEQIAAWYLRLKGFRILESGMRARRGSRSGEIDLIARRGRLVVFVEVKARRTEVEARAAITERQQKRIRHAAEIYFARLNTAPSRTQGRFDALLITPGLWVFPRITHLKGAWH